MMNNVNYIKACTEFNCLLGYLPQTYIEKIPKKLIELIKEQSNEKYNINIDINKSLAEQNFSNKTKDLIAVIKYNYWSTDEEKNKLKKMLYENENKNQKQLLEKYNPNYIFKNKEKNMEVEKTNETNVELTPYKENMFTKILNIIKKFFRKNN